VARASRAAARAAARKLLQATADADGRGLLLRGHEFAPLSAADLAGPAGGERLAARLVEPMRRLARLGDAVGTRLLDHPDAHVRRSAAIVAARAYPLLLGLDD